jgi:hypothetical protein
MALDFGSILSRAWQITWRHKVLWIFGILAGLAGGFQGAQFNYNFGGRRGPAPSPNVPPTQWPPDLRRVFGDVDPNVVIAIVAGIVLVSIVLAVIFYVLGIIGRGGLIGGVRQAQAQDNVTFGEAWAIGVRRFWPVLGISLIVFVIALLVLAASLGLAATVCLLPLACVGFLLVAALGVYTNLAQAAAVVDNLGAVAALQRAWELIRANFGGILILAIILVVVGWLSGLLLGLPLIIVVLPAILGAAAAFSGAERVLGPALAVAGLCFIAYLPVLIVLGGILNTWFGAAWTLAYQALTGPAPAPSQPLPPPAGVEV